MYVGGYECICKCVCVCLSVWVSVSECECVCADCLYSAAGRCPRGGRAALSLLGGEPRGLIGDTCLKESTQAATFVGAGLKDSPGEDTPRAPTSGPGGRRAGRGCGQGPGELGPGVL